MLQPIELSLFSSGATLSLGLVEEEIYNSLLTLFFCIKLRLIIPSQGI